MPSAIVVGAGVAGICTALCLKERGWSVSLVDRKGLGLETSFGNAGIIQADMPEPYRMPRSWRTLGRMAAGRTNDLHLRAKELPWHIPALAAYWWHSSAVRHRSLSRGYSKLVATATQEHQRWITAANAEQFIRREGYRVLFRAARDFERAASEAARLQREYGLPFRLLDAGELLSAEPDLIDPGLGALQWLAAWTVNDPGGLMAAYGETFIRAGGLFYLADVSTVKKESSLWVLETKDGRIQAEHLVVALGPWSPEFLKRFRARVRMLYKRGYHAHYTPRSTLNLTLIDAENAYVLAPMKEGVRLTTAVHIAALNSPADPVQLNRAEVAAQRLLNIGERCNIVPWMGTRPFMPAMLPVVGRVTCDASVWVNFGHGHQGLTVGPSTGRLLAELMNGERTFVDHRPFMPSKYGL